jgi:two-component system chemotaxis response regulator CheB
LQVACDEGSKTHLLTRGCQISSYKRSLNTAGSGDLAGARTKRRYQAVVIGASSGGFEALQKVLAPLPADFALPVMVVLHRDPTSDELLARLLDDSCRLTVKEADEKEDIKPSGVYIAPANYHLLVEQDRTFSLSVDSEVCYARPSIDVLFETAADAYRSGLIGILLTGANHDGTEGMKRIKERGGLTVAQDPDSAQADMMPRLAIQAHVVDRVLPLEEIASLLINTHQRGRI